MKEQIKELGFEHLPMLSEFVDKIKTDGLRYRVTIEGVGTTDNNITNNLQAIIQYCDFITQPLTKEVCYEFEYIISIGGKHLRNKGIWSHLKQFKTIEQAINAGVKLKLR